MLDHTNEYCTIWFYDTKLIIILNKRNHLVWAGCDAVAILFWSTRLFIVLFLHLPHDQNDSVRDMSKCICRTGQWTPDCLSYLSTWWLSDEFNVRLKSKHVRVSAGSIPTERIFPFRKVFCSNGPTVSVWTANIISLFSNRATWRKPCCRLRSANDLQFFNYYFYCMRKSVVVSRTTTIAWRWTSNIFGSVD